MYQLTSGHIGPFEMSLQLSLELYSKADKSWPQNPWGKTFYINSTKHTKAWKWHGDLPEKVSIGFASTRTSWRCVSHVNSGRNTRIRTDVNHLSRLTFYPTLEIHSKRPIWDRWTGILIHLRRILKVPNHWWDAHTSKQQGSGRQDQSSVSLFGCPDELMTNNGSQYSGQAFQSFVKSWSIRHITSSHHYARSNGFIERHVGPLITTLLSRVEPGKRNTVNELKRGQQTWK